MKISGNMGTIFLAFAFWIALTLYSIELCFLKLFSLSNGQSVPWFNNILCTVKFFYWMWVHRKKIQFVFHFYMITALYLFPRFLKCHHSTTLNWKLLVFTLCPGDYILGHTQYNWSKSDCRIFFFPFWRCRY